MSKINNAHFDQIVSRWRTIEIYFRNFSNKINFASAINLKMLWKFRIDKQNKSMKNI